MLIDSHSHLNFNSYKKDRSEVIQRSLDNGIWMINVGTQYLTSKRAVEIAEKYSQGVYAAVGFHPIHLETELVKIKLDPEEAQFQTHEEFDYGKYKALAQSEKVVAIGEIGLDYYWKPKTKKRLELFKQEQKDLLLKELDLAKEIDLPVIFHCRMAHNDLITILKDRSGTLLHSQRQTHGLPEVRSGVFPRGVLHCFTGTWQQAQKYLEMDFYLGFNGLIFKMNFDEVIKKTPLERILIETDCPYLTPPPKKGRNDPLYVKYVAEKIAQLKDQSYEEIAKATTENAKKLFKII